jgi:hypothetical protein
VELFEEANAHIARAMTLGDEPAAIKVAQEALYEASRLDMGDLTERLSYFIEAGEWDKVCNVVTTMNVKKRGDDARERHLTLCRISEMGANPLRPLGMPYPLL